MYHLYVARLKNLDRFKFQEVVASQDIQLGIHYYPPMHLHPAFSKFPRSKLDVTEQYSKEVVSLPMYPELSKKSVERICEVINDI